MADKENPRTGCRATESQRRLWNECLHAGARQNFPRMFFARACPNRTTTRIRTRHAQTLCESHRFRRKDQRSEADRARRLSRRIAATPRALTNVSSRDASRVEGYSEFLGLHTQKMWIFSCASSSSDWMKARKITEIELCEKRKKRARCQRVPPSPRLRHAKGKPLLVSLSASVIWISFSQFPRQSICFLGFAGLPICERGFVECTRSDGCVVVKQSDALKRFARVIEISAFQLRMLSRAGPGTSPHIVPPTRSLHAPFACRCDGLQFHRKFSLDLLNGGQAGLKFLWQRFDQARAPFGHTDRFFHVAQSIFDNEPVPFLAEQQSNAWLVVSVAQLIVHC